MAAALKAPVVVREFFLMGDALYAEISEVNPRIRRVLDLKGNWLYLTNFHIEKAYRGKGYARVLMRAVHRWADSKGVNLITHACPFDGCTIPVQDLKAFYIDTGFFPYGPRSDYIIRMAE